jgi:hypothetical protein
MVYYESTAFVEALIVLIWLFIGKIEAEITTPDFYCNNNDTVQLTAEPS